MATRVIGPDQVKRAGATPFQRSEVGTARQTPVRLEKTIGDFTDQKTFDDLNKAVQGATQTFGKIKKGIQDTTDKRQALHLKNAYTAELNDLLYNEETGVKSNQGSKALAYMDGSAREGQFKNQSVVEVARHKFKTQLEMYGKDMSPLARQAAELDASERLLAFDGELGLYRSQQQRVVDTQANKVRKVQIIDKVQRSPGKMGVIANADQESMDALAYDLDLMNIDPQSKDPEDLMIINAAKKAALSLVRFTAVDSLIKAGRTQRAREIFKLSKGKLTGDHQVKLQEALEKHTDKDAALARWKDVLTKATDDGVFSPQTARDIINEETDSDTREALLTALNSRTAFDAHQLRTSQQRMDISITKSVYSEGVGVGDLTAEQIEGASPAMLIAINSGKITARVAAVRKLAHANAATQAHIDAGGSEFTYAGMLNTYINMATDNPVEFLEATSVEKEVRSNLSLADFNRVISIRSREQAKVRKRLIEKAQGVSFKTVDSTLKDMGYPAKSKVHELLKDNLTIQDVLNSAQEEWYTDNTADMPVAKIRAALTPLMVEVMKSDRFTIQGIPVPNVGESETLFQAMGKQASFATLLQSKPDIRDKADIRRLTMAIGLQSVDRQRVQDAIDKVTGSGTLDNPTTFDILEQMAKDTYPALLKGTEAWNAMVVTKNANVDPRFMAYWMNRLKKPFTQAEVRLAIKGMDTILSTNPRMMQAYRTSFAKGLSR